MGETPDGKTCSKKQRVMYQYRSSPAMVGICSCTGCIVQMVQDLASAQMPSPKNKPCQGCSTGLTIDKFCSNKCQRNVEWACRKVEIRLNGKLPASPRVARRYLIEKNGTICEICKMDEWFGKTMPVVLDHIDGNSDNWMLENLRLICPNCDTFTPTFKSKNKGNGRYYRRQRYKDGKSF